MIAGDIVLNRFNNQEVFLLIEKHTIVDEPAWMCLDLKTFTKIWFYEHDLKFKYRISNG
jgi:hypothetical protein